MKTNLGPINVNYAEIIFQQMTYAHHFVDISQNILNLWVRLIFPELDIRVFNLSTRARQFRLKLSKIWFSEFGSAGCYKSYEKNQILGHFVCSSLSPTSTFNALAFSKYWNRLFSLILCQPSLNDLQFIFSPPLLYKLFLFSILKHTKTPYLLLSWILVK